MPKLTVGFTQKIGEPNFGSRGASVAVELDLQGPPTNPELMKAQIAGLFHLAREAVGKELARVETEPAPAPPPPAPLSPPAPPPTRALLPMNRNGMDFPTRTATPNQVRALFGLARRAGLDLKELIAERFQVRRPDDLPMKAASSLIDELKRTIDAEPAA